MKEVIRTVTPIGEGSVQFGEFQPGDGREKKYHCWWSGCGIGGQSDTLEEAKEYLENNIRDRLTRKVDKLIGEMADIMKFLREMPRKG